MRKMSLILGYFILTACAVSMVLPFVWMVCLSFMQDAQIFAPIPSFIPRPFSFEHYINVFKSLNLTRFFLNSLFAAVITTVFQVLFSAMAGYAFARAKFKYKDALFFLFLITMMVPPQVNIIPLFFLMRQLHLIDTYSALILPGLFGGFGVFLMRQWFLGVSPEIEDAARIDGCGFFSVFFKIALPLSVSALATLAIFTFITTWNSFMWPLIVTNSQHVTTLPVALASFKSTFRETVSWGDLTACCTILCAPVIILFTAGKKYFISDILAGGVKE